MRKERARASRGVFSDALAGAGGGGGGCVCVCFRMPWPEPAGAGAAGDAGRPKAPCVMNDTELEKL